MKTKDLENTQPLTCPRTSVSSGMAEPGNVPAGQRAFLHRARYNSAACQGRYTAELEQVVVMPITEKAI
jgi:hypothetical protein